MWVRGEERGVGFDQDPFRLGDGQGGAQVGGVFEGQGPGEGHVPALAVADPGQLLPAGEAVEHHPVRGALLPQHLDDVVMGVPVMDLQGQPEAFGNIDVAAEGMALMGQPNHPRCGRNPGRSRRWPGCAGAPRALRSRPGPLPVHRGRRRPARHWGEGRRHPAAAGPVPPPAP